MITKKTKALLLSTMTMMLCVVLISTATFALYTQTTTISHHLQAGKLELQLWRVGVAQHTMDDQGYLVTKTYGEQDTTPSGYKVSMDFSKGVSGENFFGLPTGKNNEPLNLLVPGAWYETTLKLVNNGDVAFKYEIEIHHSTGSFPVDVMKNTIVTITPYDSDMKEIASRTVSGSLLDWHSQSEAPFNGVFEKNEASQYVKVRVSFADVDGVSGFEGSGVNFDLIVRATQLTSAQ